MTDGKVSKKVARLQAQAGGTQQPNDVCLNCSCKVEVGSFDVVTVEDPTGGWVTSQKAQFGHLFIRYTLADGSVKFYRGGPTTGNKLSSEQGVTEFNHRNTQPSGKYQTGQTRVDDGWWSKTAFMGEIITHTGAWAGSYEQMAYDAGPQGIILVAEGPEHCGYHDQFVRIMREISSLRIRYEIPGPNSNSVVYTILKHSGLPRTKPGGVNNPGWGTDLLTR